MSRSGQFNIPREKGGQMNQDDDFFNLSPNEHSAGASTLMNSSQRLQTKNSMPPETPAVVRRIVHEDIKSVYKLWKIIGSGNFGTVRLAAPHSNPHKMVAIKSIPREKVEDEIQMLEHELLILLEVDHPNIVKFYQTYRDKKYYHLVMELCNGEELFEHLTQI
jgi:serine/threonine protein kinase